jgi:Tfp pilus assembly protein PilV
MTMNAPHVERERGFTIIETLVAISVLMIAVAGPLVVASKGLFGADLARDQMVAAYLAEESMEAVKNIRDNNIYNGSDWLSGLSTCTQTTPCDASSLDGASSNPTVSSCASGGCTVYKESTGLGHISTGATATIYTRKFYVHNASSVASCSSGDECGVTVEVYWNEGAIPYSIVLTSEITSTIR